MSVIFLDLDEVVLYGFQRDIETEHLTSILKGVDREDIFPPVYVRRVNPELYILDINANNSEGGMDGGHHRSYAHFLRGKPLRAIVTNEISDLPDYNTGSIGWIQITDRNFARMTFRTKREGDVNYR